MQLRRSRRLRPVLAGIAVVGISLSPISQATADPVDTRVAAPGSDDLGSLIDELDRLSHEAEAHTEEVKALEEQLIERERELDELGKRAAEALEQADAADDAVDDARVEVDRIAQSRYRGVTVDPLTMLIDATGPQEAIDRSAYMNALSRRYSESLRVLEDARARAGEARGAVSRAQAQAEFQAGDLRVRREKLEKERTELDQRTSEIRERVESMSAAEKLAWINKNGPVDHSLDGIMGLNPSGMSALEQAMTKIGAPYVWGATGPNAFDCSGLVVWAYAQQGKHLPRTSQAQMAGGVPVSRDQLQPGDVIGYYPGATHVGIYAGDGMVIHASDYGIPVQVVPMDSMPFVGARRY
ncbi:NlpC/P60 family protein [Corynebacterium sp. CCM 8835]|uniref:C40 family peptidase n=1 Tax=Corynebacterium antarcticum TaxID=2800405 RepID=A0A9Q4CBK7_9CORY|nr:C40 family peptidase [Corynebacterium antarcticum]MCK7641826.1 NlpC/P60 family protein [Corynebacterium antarcticum]MCK7660077.1 NlpC/P60 family protein [Corynebacterium antarcticum]MCL0245055.1 NlpC/P60 family protein [Corynebacterium antarcticum]MCX7491429.1 NlpC/P60 family protein [Corynebacterium antarcticum]MCX7537448.1 NlpC/P60 family protein [Corynebacterium antarcticum]